MTRPIAYVSDEYYAALPDTAVELRGPNGQATLTRSWPSGAVYADVPPGLYEICLSKPGYGSKRVRERIGDDSPLHFRLLSDRILGYAWPKWCKGGDRVEFRMHSVEPYKLGLWRYGLHGVILIRPTRPRAVRSRIKDKCLGNHRKGLVAQQLLLGEPVFR